MASIVAAAHRAQALSGVCRIAAPALASGCYAVSRSRRLQQHRATGLRQYATDDKNDSVEGGDATQDAAASADAAPAAAEDVDSFLHDRAFEQNFQLRMDGLDERNKGKQDRIRRRFGIPPELNVPGMREELLYRTGVTRGLGDIEPGRTHITELRTVEAYKLYGDLDRIKRTDFFHLAHADVKRHAKKLIAAGKVQPWKKPEGKDIVRYSWKNFLTPTSQQHDAARKVKLEVKVNALGLDSAARKTLIQLVGPRYQQGKGVLKLVSDRLPLREQNKAYLDDLLTTIVLEAQNPETQEIARAAKQERRLAHAKI